MFGQKRWAALHYLVARSQHEDDPAKARKEADDLLEKARVEIKLICDGGRAHFDKMHVAYHLEFLEFEPLPSTAFTVRAVRGKVMAATGDAFEEKVPVLENVPEERRRVKDLRRFFRWAADNNLASHRAIFFWGHSAGPAGIFELLKGPEPPDDDTLLPQGLPQRAKRLKRRLAAVFPRLTLPNLAHAFVELPQPCDVVLFKDCWMACLEAAYELADHVGAIIASQSQVPTLAVWPYTELYEALTELGEGPDMVPAEQLTRLVSLLRAVYESDASRTINGVVVPSIPFSLLDITRVRGVLKPMIALIEELGTNPTTLTRDQRNSRIAFDDASTGPFPEAAGDVALVDVRRLCSRVETMPPSTLGTAAKALRQAVDQVIVDPADARDACSGASLFYQPSQRRMQALPPAPKGFSRELVIKNMHALPYQNLALNVDMPGATWFDIAFEQ